MLPDEGQDLSAGCADRVIEDPAGAAAKADCFMYLELYPELLEIDPGLAALCKTDPAGAQRAISALLEELGL